MKNIILALILITLFSIEAFSQDSSSVKAIYKIPSSELVPHDGNCKTVILPREKKSVHSCEHSADKKHMIITTIPADGIPVKESRVIKQEEKTHK